MSTAQHDPIWTRPEPRGRKPRFTRDQITAAALRIADADGFEAVTMKRIAEELGAGTMTLYHYVRTKADVVALMHDEVMAEVLIAGDDLPSGWHAGTTDIARRTRAMLLAHPWSPTSLDDAQFGPNAMRHMEQSLAVLAGTGLGTGDKLALIAAVDDYVLGNAMHANEATGRAAAAREDPEMVSTAIDFGVKLLETGEFPELSALYAEQAGADPAEADGPPMTDTALTQQFERGLVALLDGLAAQFGL